MQLRAKTNQSTEYLKALQDLGEISDEPIQDNDSYASEPAIERVQKKE